jgi:hypothetical protein
MNRYQYDTNYFLVGKEETFTIKRFRKPIEVVKQEFLGGWYINGIMFSQGTIRRIENEIRKGDEQIKHFVNYDEYFNFVGEEMVLRLLEKQR